MGNDVFEETEAIVDAVARLREVLPPRWTVEWLAKEARSGDLRADGLVMIIAPGSVAVTFLAEVKRWTTEPTSRVAGVLSSLQRQSPYPVLLITDYTNGPLRGACRELGISFVDEAGWVLIRSDDPPMLISTEGRSRRAPRDGHQVSRLNGPAASRIIRALLEVKPPIGVRELQALAGVSSAGSVSKLLPTLAAADALERDDRGQVVDINRRALLDRWTADYSFRASNHAVMNCLAPRGLEPLIDRLRSAEALAVTGSVAAQSYLSDGTVPVIPAGRLAVYAYRPASTANVLGLVEVEEEVSNVTIANPRESELLVAPAHDESGLPIAPLPQVLADLMGLPGRESLLAEQLMDQLAETDPLWRSR
jgi:hypothetical protein